MLTSLSTTVVNCIWSMQFMIWDFENFSTYGRT